MPQNNHQPRKDFKKELRRKMRARRGQLSDSLRRSYDVAIRQNIQHQAQARDVKSIAGYWAFDGEPDIMPLCKQVCAQGQKIALPVVSEQNNHTMNFHLWHTDDALQRNRYGIYEPLNTAIADLPDFDILLMPLLAYDRHGNRIGMGAGYYDRHLENLHDSPKPLRVGVAYSMQEIEPFTVYDWDIPLHAVVTEQGWFTFSNKTTENRSIE